MKVVINNEEVDVIIVYKNNKNLYIRVKDNKFYVTCNKYYTIDKIKEIINNNITSLTKMYNKALKVNNNTNYYLGKEYIVVYDCNVKKLFIDNDMIFVKDKKMLENFFHNECLRIFEERINIYRLLFKNLPIFKLKVRSMKTRWGVNNQKSMSITLNSELIKKDISLIDYVVVHELCHFYEANHSKRFWLEVEKRYPYYKLARKRMRVE